MRDAGAGHQAAGGDGAMDPDRRAALRAVFLGAGGAVALTAERALAATGQTPAGPGHAHPQSATTAPTGLSHLKHRQWGMAIDLDRCVGCGACAVACQQENNIPPFSADSRLDGARIEWLSMLWLEGDEPGTPPQLLPFPCQHCVDAPCVKVCPVNATYKDSEGITVQVWDRCIGCRYCMVACPYSRRSFNWQEPEWDGSLVQLLNPDVATRTAGIVEKCTFCSHRIKRTRQNAALEGREPTDGELQRLPACAAACPADAITFGDVSDPESKVAGLAKSPRLFRLLEELGTRPSVFYLKRDNR